MIRLFLTSLYQYGLSGKLNQVASDSPEEVDLDLEIESMEVCRDS